MYYLINHLGNIIVMIYYDSHIHHHGHHYALLVSYITKMMRLRWCRISQQKWWQKSSLLKKCFVNFISVKFINMPSTFPTLSQKYTSKIKTICDSLGAQSWILQCNMHGFSLWHSPTLINLNSFYSFQNKIFSWSFNQQQTCLSSYINKWKGICHSLCYCKEGNKDAVAQTL